MRKFLLACFSFWAACSLAYDAHVGNLYYNLDRTTMTAMVVSKNWPSALGSDFQYTGALEIPSTINVAGDVFTVTSIGQYTFYGADGLTSVTIPETVTDIGRNAFTSCTSLTSVTMTDNVTTLGERAFYDCNHLTDVTLSKGLTVIEELTFYGCDALQSITIPEGVTELEYAVFMSCDLLNTVSLPSTLTKMGGSTFYDTPLKVVYCYADTPPTISTSSLGGTFAACKVNEDGSRLYVMANSVDAYLPAAKWKDFWQVTAMFFDEVPYTRTTREETSKVQKEYYRNFKNTQWQAWYMPFSMTAAIMNQHFSQVGKLVSVDRGAEKDELTVQLLSSGELMQPNTPYVVKAKDVSERTITVGYPVIEPNTENSVDFTLDGQTYTFTGTYSGLTTEQLRSNTYYALGGGTIHKASSTARLNPHRWYMSVTGGSGEVKQMSMRVIDADETPVELLEMNAEGEWEETGRGEWHNLQGQRVEHPSTRGIYVRNGRKYVVR
ncbi:MAG: leucine-rich repeat domain-containing protein [Bacteroidaceae bacterium]|nr:leucine-rich repeat domain-containing protein [Bacteroidaceae bacterium]